MKKSVNLSPTFIGGELENGQSVNDKPSVNLPHYKGSQRKRCMWHSATNV